MTEETFILAHVIYHILNGDAIQLENGIYIQLQNGILYQFTQVKKEWDRKELKGSFMDFIHLMTKIPSSSLIPIWFASEQKRLSDV